MKKDKAILKGKPATAEEVAKKFGMTELEIKQIKATVKKAFVKLGIKHDKN